jgi:regulator of protease activity HflC (stomatin/prohibitin superfamily)
VDLSNSNLARRRETDVTITQNSAGRLNQTVSVKQSALSRVDLRENIMDFCNQSIITRDNVAIDVHPMLVFRLTDPVRVRSVAVPFFSHRLHLLPLPTQVAYETFDIAHAVEKLVQTTLRSVIGDMGLDDTLASREEIERGLASRIKHIAHDWGLEIKSVELLEITPSISVQNAMHKQIGAERVRRADIVTADGVREKLKLEAEGHMQAAIAMATGQQRASIIQATGNADAKLSIAQAESESVGIIAKALAEYDVNPAQYMVGLKYIQTLAAIAGRASKRTIYFPYEADVVGSLAEVSR